jgi:hypothetical protein
MTTARDEREAAVNALAESLKTAQQDQLVALLELLRIQVACQELADFCATLCREPERRRQSSPVPDLPSRAHVEDVLKRLHDAAARADACSQLLRSADAEPERT